MEVGETVVLVGDVDGMPAGKEGLVMRVRGDMLLIGCRFELPETPIFRALERFLVPYLPTRAGKPLILQRVGSSHGRLRATGLPGGRMHPPVLVWRTVQALLRQHLRIQLIAVSPEERGRQTAERDRTPECDPGVPAGAGDSRRHQFRPQSP
jgi:hypothetical protein